MSAFPSLRKRKVSERSLELNVLSEAIELIRRYMPKAYIVGYTTRQEAHHGLDASIDAPGKIIAAFQFKAPSNSNNNVYRFKIGDRCWICSNPRLGSSRRNRSVIVEVLQNLGLPKWCINQHTILYVIAVILETFMDTPVYYAFPLTRNYEELEQRVPGIVNYTILIRVRDMPIRTVLDCRTHNVEVVLPPTNDPRNAAVIIRSNPEELPRDKYVIMGDVLKELVKKRKEETKRSIHLDPLKLQQLLEKEFKEKAIKENLDSELINRAELMAQAIAKISFSYRGTALAAKHEEEH